MLSFCNARQMAAPEGYVKVDPAVFLPDGTVTNPGTEAFLRAPMAEYHDHVKRVLAVLPRP